MQQRDFFGRSNIGLNRGPLERVLEDTQKLYLCGIEFARFLNPEIQYFYRLQNYLQVDLSHECSALAMIALRSIPSTKVVQGLVANEGEIYRHAWNEFTFGGEEFVADLAWATPFIIPKERYYNLMDDIDPRWICKYNVFWSLTLSKSLYENMRHRDTSDGVFEPLENYGVSSDKYSDDYGFQSTVVNTVCNPDFFCPYERNGRVLSASVIEELVTRPWLTEPTKETINMAQLLVDILNTL